MQSGLVKNKVDVNIYHSHKLDTEFRFISLNSNFELNIEETAKELREILKESPEAKIHSCLDKDLKSDQAISILKTEFEIGDARENYLGNTKTIEDHFLLRNETQRKEQEIFNRSDRNKGKGMNF